MAGDLSEYIARQEAVAVEQARRQTRHLGEIISALQSNNKVLKNYLRLEVEHSKELEARCAEAEIHTQNHDQTVQLLLEEQQLRKECQERSEASEARAAESERMCLDAETRCARVEEALDLARVVHARELEQARTLHAQEEKRREETEKSLRQQLEEMMKQRDDLKNKITAINRMSSG